MDFPLAASMVKQESDNSTQDDSCNNFDTLTGLTYDTKPVLLCGDSSNMDKLDSWIGDGIIPDADVKQHDTKIGEGIKSKSSNCYAIKSGHANHTYATTSDRYNINAVKSELTDTCTEQEPIHYVENHVSTLHCERRVQNINLTEQNIVNSQIKTHSCPHCHKSFGCASSLNAHIKTHTGIISHVCPHCSKICDHFNYLTSHMRTRTEQKPHMCQQFNKEFNQHNNLKIHSRIGEKLCPCLQCDERFNRASGLTVHMRTHTGERPYSCIQCDKRFTRASHLKVHMKTHTGVKRYSCHRCDKRFHVANQLKGHMRIHTGINPYSCLQCGNIFSNGSHSREILVHKTNWS